MNVESLQVLSYESFILFNNTGIRINQDDVLYRGFDINPVVDEILYALSFKTELKYITMINNITKIQKMLEMANPKDVIMTKFFNKIRASHKIASGFGEKFVSLNIFLGVYPNKDLEPLLSNQKAKVDEIDDIEVESETEVEE